MQQVFKHFIDVYTQILIAHAGEVSAYLGLFAIVMYTFEDIPLRWFFLCLACAVWLIGLLILLGFF